MGRVQDRVVIVTGGAGGIGAAACRAIAAEDGKVVVADLDATAARAVADSIRRQRERHASGDLTAEWEFDALERESTV